MGMSTVITSFYFLTKKIQRTIDIQTALSIAARMCACARTRNTRHTHHIPAFMRGCDVMALHDVMA